MSQHITSLGFTQAINRQKANMVSHAAPSSNVSMAFKSVTAPGKAANLKQQARAEVARAKSLASVAKSATASRQPQKAGAALVGHLTATRNAIALTAQAVKAEAVGVQQKEAQKAQGVAVALRDQASKLRSAGRGEAAMDVEAKANLAQQKATAHAIGARTIAVTAVPVPIPSALTGDNITSLADRYNTRVTRRVSAEDEDMSLLVSVLGTVSEDGSDFDDFSAAVLGYGGGAIGLAFAGAEFGNVAAMSRGLGALEDSLDGFFDDPWGAITSAVPALKTVADKATELKTAATTYYDRAKSAVTGRPATTPATVQAQAAAVEQGQAQKLASDAQAAAMATAAGQAAAIAAEVARQKADTAAAEKRNVDYRASHPIQTTTFPVTPPVVAKSNTALYVGLGVLAAVGIGYVATR